MKLNKKLVLGVVLALVIAVASLILSACGAHCDQTPSSVFFVTNPKGRSGLEAQMFGKLVVTDGVLRLEAYDGITSYLPIWPKGFKLCLTKDGRIRLLNNAGQVVAYVGDEVEMGGGEGQDNEYFREWLAKIAKQPVPASAIGPFWFVGAGVKLSMRLDSQLFNIDIVSMGDSELLFVRSTPLLDLWVLEDAAMHGSWLQKKSTITGNLTIFGRFLCVDSIGVFWPSDYRASFQNGVITIVNQKDGTSIRVGDRITVEGNGVIDDRNPRFLRLRDELPLDAFSGFFVSKISIQIESPDGS